jgi:aminopeptidase N
LEKLRQTIGHDEFISGLKEFMDARCFGIATLHDLQTAFEQSHGGSLDWFFIPWFSNGYLPDYAVRDALFDHPSARLTFDIVDLNHGHHEQDYHQEIPVAVYNSDGTMIASLDVWVNGSASVALVLPDVPDEIRLDYTGYVLVQLWGSETDYYSTDIIAQSYLADIGPLILLAAVVVLMLSVLLIIRRKRNRPAGSEQTHHAGNDTLWEGGPAVQP